MCSRVHTQWSRDQFHERSTSHMAPISQRQHHPPALHTGTGDATATGNTSTGGGGGSAAGSVCFSWVKSGKCNRGDKCRISHDPAVCANARGVSPAAVGRTWALKWLARNEPTRSIDPPVRINGGQVIKGPWVLAADRWTIVEQCEGKCHKFHIMCDKTCACALCSVPGGQDWPSKVDESLKPVNWPGK